jgi:predicted ATPase/DNA-binding XRE family transcriptional regulator
MSGLTSSTANFGELLRDYRRKAGYSQEALAERAGLSAGAIAALEQGLRRAPYRYTVGALAEALGLTDEARREFEETAASARARPRGRQRDANEAEKSGNVPVRLTSFVGRETEMAELEALLKDHRLVTVIGSGGVGKTRIATEIARAFLDNGWNEAWFVDLAPIERGEHVAGTIAEVLGNAAPASKTLPLLAAQLRRRECLLILDNCEHVIDEVAAAAGAIVRNCPGITILATSRERLAIDGEHVYRLPSLSAVEALHLFEERANASDARATLTADSRETEAQICRQLEGVPLAIELAATRVPTLGLDVLNARLRDYVVISGGRDLPERQRTMYATIAWSYDLLREAEQNLLRRLSIFRGAMTLEGAEVVCATDTLAREQVAAHMSQLVDKSLVEVRSDAGQGRRYSLLDSVRRFAVDKLVEAGESISIARAHARRMADVADHADELLWAPDRGVWYKRFFPELDDARSAIEWALSSDNADDAALAGRILSGLRGLWTDAERRTEGGWLAERILARLDDERFSFIAARLLRIVVQAAQNKAAVVAAIERATPVFERVNDKSALIGTHLQLALHCSIRGEFVEADEAMARAFALAADERLQQSGMYFLMLEHRGVICARAGRLEEARADFTERRQRRTLLGILDHREDARWEALIAFVAGNLHEAMDLLEQAIAYREETGTFVDTPNDLAAIYLTLGDNIAAASLLRGVLESVPFLILGNDTIAGSLAWGALDSKDALASIQHMAAVAARSAEFVTAARLLGFTDASYQANSIFRDPYERASYDIIVASLREHLTPVEIERYVAEGAQLDLEQAADLALKVIP